MSIFRRRLDDCIVSRKIHCRKVDNLGSRRYHRDLRCDGNALDALVDKGSSSNCLGLAHISASKRHQNGSEKSVSRLFDDCKNMKI